ncbi:response regulator transcription factor [Bacillus sp. JJ1764]|uniref:response regulator transcription factor n=1 Tax=Bacillus sp. JJ1764 TaxID=3122964 RepID=UPI002FFF30AB
MIKVIIIDDEYIVRKGLIATIDWQKFDMEVCGDAANGQKGLELFIEHSPEVVITDIVMPEMNGIELARKIKQKAPGTKILLLSCHRDFEFAQEGIRLGAAGYILKTAFQDEEFEEYLTQFANEIGKGKNSSSAIPATALTKEFYEWLCGFDNSFASILEDKCKGEWSWIHQPFYIYHLIHLGQGISSVEQHMDILFPDITTKIICGHDQCFMFIPQVLHNHFETLLIKAKQNFPALQWNVNGPNIGTEQWLTGVHFLYSNFKIEQQFNVSIDQWPEPIQKAVQMIIDDLSHSFSSVEIAQKVNLSRSHFSTLFKKSVGESFYNFTEKFKLNAACELLEATSLTLQQIGEKIGIQDGKYFSKWFKKCTGLTPSEYRQTKRRNS